MLEDQERLWWERKWREREEALYQAFGPSHPTGSPESYVTAFDFSEVRLPGACAYTFPPEDGDLDRGREKREHWLYLTHGLTQWGTEKEMRAARASGHRDSGRGYELGMILDEEAPWVPGLLRALMTYAHRAKPLNAGDRMPLQFQSGEGGATRWTIGAPDPQDPPPIDETRALVFWRYLSSYGSFTTSTGTFEIRIASTITGREWELAKATSTCHLLLLLCWAGIGQRSIPGRASVTESDGWEQEWKAISALSLEQTKERLRAIWRS